MPLHTKKSATMEKLTLAAAQLFARQGYHGTSTREIARLAGVSENTIFRHFDRKEALFRSEGEAYAGSGPVVCSPGISRDKHARDCSPCWRERKYHLPAFRSQGGTVLVGSTGALFGRESSPGYSARNDGRRCSGSDFAEDHRVYCRYTQLLAGVAAADRGGTARDAVESRHLLRRVPFAGILGHRQISCDERPERQGPQSGSDHGHSGADDDGSGASLACPAH